MLQAHFDKDKPKSTNLKVHQIHDIYQEGQFIDARDSQGDWRVGYIVQKSQKSKLFKVRFDGWQAKWDQYYKFGIHKLQHFRTITIGYTGQKVYPAIRPSWKFQIAQHINKCEELRTFMDKGRFTADPHKMTQFLRGQNYIYIDFLLGNTYQDVQHLKQVVQYLKFHLDLTQKYIDTIDPSFKKYNKALQNKEESIVVDSQSAYYHSFYQIFDACVQIFGGVNRLNSFYKDNKQLLFTLLKCKSQTPQPTPDMLIKPLFYNHFVENGGWNSFIILLSRLVQQKRMIPFTFLKSLFNLYLQLDKYAMKQKNKKTLQMLLQIYKRNIEKISQKQIKDLDRTLVSEVIEKVKALFARLTQKDSILKFIQKTELEVSYKFFKSPYFQKKLKGISSIKQILQNISKNTQATTPSGFLEWALKSNFLKQIFGDSIHVEILKRASEIFKLFCQNKTITYQILDLIWEAREGKHQAIIKALDQLIADMVFYLPPEMTEYLFNKIKSVQLGSWDQDFLELVKNYSSNALRKLQESNANKYGLHLLYEYSTKKQDEKSLSYFFDILNIVGLQDELNQYRNISFKKIKLNMSSYFHVCLLLKIQKQSHSTIQLNSNVVDILISDILKYSQYHQQLQTRFNLLQIILYKHQNAYLQPIHFQRLWDEFKIKQHKSIQIFLNWICKYEDNTYKINTVLHQSLRQYIFKDVLCNSKKNDFFSLDSFQWQIYLAFFIDVNIALSKLIISKNACQFKVKNYDLFGLSQIWSIFLNCKNQEVIQKIAQSICDIHCKLSIQLQTQKKEIGLQLIKKNINYISTGAKNQNFRLIKNCVLILLKFINKIQGKYEYNPTQKLRFTSYRQITFINSLTNEKKQIKFNIALSFGCLKNQISTVFNRPIRGIKLQHKGATIGSQMDHIPYYSCAFTQAIYYTPIQIQVNFVKQEINNYLQLLFSLLSTQVSNQIWKLLSQLPVSPQFKHKIQNAQFWQQLISGGIYRQLYVLKIIQSMKVSEWQKFVKFGGIRTLLKKIDVNIHTNNIIQKQYIKIITFLLFKNLCSSIKQPELQNAQAKERLCLKLIIIMDKLCIHMRKRQIQKTQQLQQSVFDTQKQIASHIFFIFQKIKKQVPIIKLMLNYYNLQSLLKGAFIQSDNSAFKDIVANQIIKIIFQTQRVSAQQIKQMLILLFTKIFQFALTSVPKRTTKFFHFCTILIQKLDIAIIKSLTQSIPGIILRLIKLIEDNKGQHNFRQQNQIIQGLINMLRGFFTRKEVSAQIEKQTFLRKLLNECLFNLKDFERGPKCKSYSTRHSAFKLLTTLMNQSTNNLFYAINFLKRFHFQAQWRTKKITQWTITPKMNQKSLTGYVGLKNLGCICYMNSFLQQMFMIPSFRESVLAVDDPLFDKSKIQDNLLYQLKTMFLGLQKSDQQYYSPKGFCHAFKDYQGKPTNLSQQMDIDQFSSVLFDKLENQVGGSKNQNFIKQHFGGVLSNQIICKGCPHFSQRQEPFLSISLQVKNKKDIYQSLQTMIKGEMLQGDNAYHCDRCNKKVSALKRVSLKQLPNHLIIALKRFQFNYQTMTKLKINDLCQFPTHLNLSEYSQQHLRKNEKKPTELQDQYNFPKEYFEYQLKGVVIHMGFADSGHYYSYIQKRDSNNEWFQFNDTLVRKFDAQNIPNEAFGGEQKSYDVISKQKIRNAYLLFYDRKQIKQENMVIQVDRLKTPYCQKFIEQLKIQNERYYMNRLLFAKQYQDFIKDLLNVKFNNKQQQHIELIKFSIIFFLTRTVRQKQKRSAFQIITLIKAKIHQYPEITKWVLQVFSQESILIEFFKSNPSRQIRKLLSNFIVDICYIRYVEQGKGAKNRLFQIEQKYPKTILANFINSLIKMIGDKITLTMNQIFAILYKISLFGQEIAQYLLSKHIIGIVLQHIMQKQGQKIFNKELLPTLPQQNIIGKLCQSDQKESLFELLSQRKNKLQFQKTYIWCLLSQLLKHCNLKKVNNYPAYSYQTKFQLPSEEYALIYLSSNIIYKSIQQAKNKLLIRKVVNYLCLLSIQDIKFSEQLLKLIGKALKVLQSTKFRSYFVLFKQMIRIPDQYQQKRIEGGITQIRSGIQQNKKYFVESDIIQQWLLKIAKKNKKLRDYFRVYDSTIRTILAMIKEKKAPAEELTRKHRQPCERMVHILHGVQLPKSVSAYIQLSKIKQTAFTHILKGQPFMAQEWDSDDDLAQMQVPIGSAVSLFIDATTFNFIEATVTSNIYDFLTITNKDQKISIWKDDQTLTSFHKVNSVDDKTNGDIIHSDQTASNQDEIQAM